MNGILCTFGNKPTSRPGGILVDFQRLEAPKIGKVEQYDLANIFLMYISGGSYVYLHTLMLITCVSASHAYQIRRVW
jgi:hypothetical protein